MNSVSEERHNHKTTIYTLFSSKKLNVEKKEKINFNNLTSSFKWYSQQNYNKLYVRVDLG